MNVFVCVIKFNVLIMLQVFFLLSVPLDIFFEMAFPLLFTCNYPGKIKMRISIFMVIFILFFGLRKKRKDFNQENPSFSNCGSLN